MKSPTSKWGFNHTKILIDDLMHYDYIIPPTHPLKDTQHEHYIFYYIVIIVTKQR